MSPDYREVVRELERMEARPWWHRDRWLLRWYALTQPARTRWWRWRRR